MALKKRAKWWIVSTHVLTTGFAMPAVAGLAGAVVVGGSGLPGLPALVALLAFQAVGYIGGTYYSLAYLRKSATTDDWLGCIKPSVITFVILAIIGLAINAVQIGSAAVANAMAAGGSRAVAFGILVVYYIAIVAGFVKITADGFRKFQAQAKPVQAG
jgi:hypothetical protein